VEDRIYPYIFLICCFFSVNALAFDIENAKRINKSCALCHGQLGQGTPSASSPRLAGLNAKYLKKEMEFYRSGKRENLSMVIASSIKTMTDKDIDDISHYLAQIDIEHSGRPVLNPHSGDIAAGKDEFLGECKTCHGRDGLGKEKKGAPMVAGQHGSYLFMQMQRFQTKERHHDDDPDDDTFEDYSEADLNNLIAFLTDTGLKRIALARETGAGKPKEDRPVVALINALFNKERKDSASKFKGAFRVSERGEIILSPKFSGMSSAGGIKGEFAIEDGKVIFYPNKRLLHNT